jgi:hypothetical protein
MVKKDKSLINKDTKDEIDRLQLDVNQVTRTKSILNPNQIQKLWNRTPVRFQYSRDGRGGKRWTYVKKSYMKRVLDSVFGFNWSFEENQNDNLMMILEVAKATGTVVVRGKLTCVVMDDRGNEVTRLIKSDAGSVPVKFKQGSKELLDFGNDIKAAYSDCLKRCAAQLGIAADVYDAQDFMDIEILGSDEANERNKNLKSKISKARATIKKESTKVGEQNGGKM